MKQALHLLAAIMFGTVAAAQSLPTSNRTLDPITGPRMVMAPQKAPKLNMWLPQIIKTYRDGKFLSQTEYTRDALANILYYIDTNADGTITRTTNIWNYDMTNYDVLREKYVDGKWIATQKKLYTTGDNRTENYDTDGNITTADKTIITSDTASNGDIFYKQEYYTYKKDSGWSLRSTSTRNTYFDKLGRCTLIKQESGRPDSPYKETITFLYEGDHKEPYYCKVVTVPGNVNSPTDSHPDSVEYSNIEWAKYGSTVSSDNPRLWIVSTIKNDTMYFTNQLVSADYKKTNNSNIDFGKIYVTYNGIGGYEYNLIPYNSDNTYNEYYQEELGIEEQTGRAVKRTKDIEYQDANNNRRFDVGEPFNSYITSCWCLESWYPGITFDGAYYYSYINGDNGRYSGKMTKYNEEHKCWEEYESSSWGYNNDYIVRNVVTKYQFFSESAAVSSPSVKQAAAQGVYNLQGMKVGETTTNLPAGIYIVKQGNKTTKVVVER